MPQIRFEIERFVEEWNNHKIRTQKNRRHVHAGIPFDLFNKPTDGQDAVDCQLPLPEDRWQELYTLAQYDGVSLNQYLPEEIHKLCDQFFEQYTGPQDLTSEAPYLSAYQYMREMLQAHRDRQEEPRLHLLERPTGGWNVFEARMAEAGFYNGRLLAE